MSLIRIALFALGLGIGLAGCTDGTDPKVYLKPEEQKVLLERLAPYIAPPPEGVSGKERLDARHQAYYRERAKGLELAALVVNEQDTAEFMVYRIAPSLKEKKVAVAGKLYPAHGTGDFSFYEEAFWTWKMEPPLLQERAPMLFRLYQNGESLTPYENTAGNGEWIEFPDENTLFNRDSRTWVRDATID